MAYPLLHAGAQHRLQMAHAAFAAGAHGSARQSWIEVSRPISMIGLNVPIATQITGATSNGGTLNITGANAVNMPIGMDIKSITCAAVDVDCAPGAAFTTGNAGGWQLTSFLFGTLNLVNPVTQAGVGVNLSIFDPRLPHIDRVAPWILAETNVDVTVTAVLVAFCGIGNTAFFHGFSINAYQKEQVCQIQSRIVPTARNMGNFDIMDHLQQAYSAISGYSPQGMVSFQPHAQTGAARAALSLFQDGPSRIQ